MKQRFFQVGLLILTIVLFSATVFAAPNWSFVENDGYGKETYIDLNSIAPYNGNQNIVRVSFMAKNPIDYYSMLMNIETNQWSYFESAEWGYPGHKFLGWNKQELDWRNYERDWPIPKVVLGNLNGKNSSVSPPSMQENGSANGGGILLYNGPLMGKGYEIINKETGVDAAVHKIILSQLTTGNSSYDGDAWINIRTDNARTIRITVNSELHRNDVVPAASYRAYQVRFEYCGRNTVTYCLPQKQLMLGSTPISIPGEIEVDLSGNTITAKLIINGDIVSRMQVKDEEVTFLKGKLTMMGAKGNLKIYK